MRCLVFIALVGCMSTTPLKKNRVTLTGACGETSNIKEDWENHVVSGQFEAGWAPERWLEIGPWIGGRALWASNGSDLTGWWFTTGGQAKLLVPFRCRVIPYVVGRIGAVYWGYDLKEAHSPYKDDGVNLIGQAGGGVRLYLSESAFFMGECVFEDTDKKDDEYNTLQTMLGFGVDL